MGGDAADSMLLTFLREYFHEFGNLNMGNCCERCFGRLDKRKYLRTRYNVERDFSIEFENLMDDETQQEEITNNVGVVSAQEKTWLLTKRFDSIVQEQKKLDVLIDEKLVRQEEELRMEEEAYYEAKREAARATKAQRQKEQGTKGPLVVRNGPKAWIGDDESDWEVAGGEDDFEMFLESVKERSLAARTRALPSQVPIDAASETSSKDDRSRTEASSIDLEWEHEAGMQPAPKERRRKQPTLEENIAELNIKPMLLREKQESLSNDYEWDNDFVNGNDQTESQTLLSKSTDEETDR